MWDTSERRALTGMHLLETHWPGGGQLVASQVAGMTVAGCSARHHYTVTVWYLACFAKGNIVHVEAALTPSKLEGWGYKISAALSRRTIGFFYGSREGTAMN